MTSDLIESSICTGTLAAAATSVAAAVCGEIDSGNGIAPLNAVSHIAWGEKAAAQDDASFKYTATGLALNAAAVTSWAVIHQMLVGKAAAKGEVDKAVLSGMIVSALAYVTDYHFVPAWLTPGFEKRLSGHSLLAIYGTLALCLAAGSLLQPRRS